MSSKSTAAPKVTTLASQCPDKDNLTACLHLTGQFRAKIHKLDLMI